MEHFDTSEEDKKSWAIYDEWRIRAVKNTDDFTHMLQEWETFVLAHDQDISNWARQKAIQEASETLDWNNGDASNTCKNAYENVRSRIMKGLDTRQDERLGVIPKRKEEPDEVL